MYSTSAKFFWAKNIYEEEEEGRMIDLVVKDYNNVHREKRKGWKTFQKTLLHMRICTSRITQHNNAKSKCHSSRKSRSDICTYINNLYFITQHNWAHLFPPQQTTHQGHITIIKLWKCVDCVIIIIGECTKLSSWFLPPSFLFFLPGNINAQAATRLHQLSTSTTFTFHDHP